MRIIKALIVIALLTLIHIPYNAHAFQYIGELCWQGQNPFNNKELLIFKLGVFDLGSSHYYLSGASSNSSTTITGNGNAEIIEDAAFINLNAIALSDPIEASMSVVFQLDTNTLNGQYTILAHIYNS
ncbi:secreted protein, partial [Candidatus Magnetoovum chiemensis]